MASDEHIYQHKNIRRQEMKKEKSKKKAKFKMKRRNTGSIRRTFYSTGVRFGLSMAPEYPQFLFECSLDHRASIDYGIFENVSFPFENLVLEGGGMKGLAYIGAFQVLEKANILQNIKRVCGVSIGSVLATFLVCGYTLNELQLIMLDNLNDITIDHKCGLCSLIPNIRKKYGWNPGKRYTKWIGKLIENKLGNRNLTFKELFEKTGKELCVVVTNLSQMITEYFHVKTTPNFPIAEAVRMSTAIPGMFQASILKKDDGSKDVYVDGGILCNYPIHAFDGWWLSLKQGDSFFKRFMPINNCSHLLMKNERFSPYNEATLGLVLYSEDEAEPMKAKFEKRKDYHQPHPPNTKYYRQQKDQRKREEINNKENLILENAIVKLSKLLQEIETSDRSTILVSRFLQEIKSALYMSLMRSNVEERDVQRTIGINTGYIGTTDFEIEAEDRKYLVECGAEAARAFLREYCSLHPERRKGESGMISRMYIRSITEEREREKLREEDEKERENIEAIDDLAVVLTNYKIFELP